MKIHKTFEFGNIGEINRASIEPYLIEVWQQRFAKLNEELHENENPRTYQGVLSFDSDKAKAKNYIGFIQAEDEQIEIYPKVFRQRGTNDVDIRLYLKHLFFWFDYCRKWKFPFTKNNLDQNSVTDFPELIINLMADRIKEVISESPISLYEEIEESLTMPRGRIHFGRYISNGLTNGNHYIIECDTEPLVYDNNLNRAIKYVTRLLYTKAKFNETREKLSDIIFILDEVEDVPCNSAALNSIQINRFYSDYGELIDICRLVLDQQLYNNNVYEQTQWSLLFPMEYIFEDFIAGFLETHFGDEWTVEYQKSNKTLTDQGVFKMKHDIYLTNKEKPSIKVIVDTKYKLRSTATINKDAKKGIDQNDLYQMTSYAFRRGCKSVLLLYPNYDEELQPNNYFSITSDYVKKDKIDVIAAEVPFWNMTHFEGITETSYLKLNSLLKEFKTQLVK